MLSAYIKEKLKKNWGDKANALDCYAEVKLIDPLSSWACYIYAMDSEEQVIHCLIYSDLNGPQVYIIDIAHIYSMYNENGDHPILDEEFRRMKVNTLLRRLKYDA